VRSGFWRTAQEDQMASAHEPGYSSGLVIGLCGSENVVTSRPQIDRESRAWLAELRLGDPRRDRAIRRLYALLLTETRSQTRRWRSSLRYPGARELDDLAVQAADDAVLTILARLDQFRGESLFLTWARRIAQRGMLTALRLEGAHELPVADGFERGLVWPRQADEPYERSAAREATQALVHSIGDDLTARQRSVLVAVTLNGVGAAQLARRLDTKPGAIYKTLYDARRKLRERL
jgi:RNA polymerase sigma-70 factor (ECF subfamily)